MMNKKGLLHNRKIRIGLSLALIAAIFVGLLVPGSDISVIQPSAPSITQEVLAYDSLSLGEMEDTNESKDEQDEESDDGGRSEDEKRESEDSQKEQAESEDYSDKTDKENDSSEAEKDGTGDGDDGTEDGIEGDEGDETVEHQLSALMTWYKYGRQAKTVVCDPSNTVKTDVNTAQLKNGEFKYEFSLVGEEAKHAKILSVSMKEGDGQFRDISDRGKIAIEIPNAVLGRTYTFQIKALWKTNDAEGKRIEEEVEFNYEIHFAYAIDLELELTWAKSENRTGKVTIPANEKVAKTIESNDIEENKFIYSPVLTGALAKDAKLISGEYSTASGETGTLDVGGGILPLKAKGRENKETYNLTFTAEVIDEDGIKQKVYYHMSIVYRNVPDVDVSFTWLERGISPRTMICQPDGRVSANVKNNQLSAGAVKYEISLIGDEAENARILNITYKSQATAGGTLSKSGAIPMILPAGQTSNTYNITVTVLSGGRQMTYEIQLTYSMDIQLEMTYTVNETGADVKRTVLCENGKTAVADSIYDDQLKNGMLSYNMATTGTERLDILSVKCYQSGSGSNISLDKEDSVKLLLNEGRTGENTFRITAQDKSGAVYQFCIMIPYKHRGENIIKIRTNMMDGQTVTNEAETNLNVTAWSEDESGKVVSYIPANGEDTKLIVKLDGKTLKYVSTSGAASEFILYPDNPDKGDTNEHILTIYAEDPYGNYGELTIKLKGQRKDSGQNKGSATIRIDMTVLGMGVVESMSYEVLADEPVSYSIAKAVLGKDTGEPFGAVDNALGWDGKYLGTLDTGFYLQRLTPRLMADTLTGSSWNKYGSNEEEILKAIDEKFGEGTGLATLWRCIYRNGLNKSGGTNGSYGEFDFTSGSGWLFSLNGTYYPGLAMCEYRLEDGDVLTLRYTLAHGWEVGGGTAGYGNTLGYCVTALDGKFYIDHQMEKVTNEDGSVNHVCRCCGLEEGCLHEKLESKNLGDGTHVAVCSACKKTIGNAELHTWSLTENEHTCDACGASAAHTWKEEKGSDTATCTEGGTRKVFCSVCNMTREEISPAKGHTLNNRWSHTATEHYQKCSACKETVAESKGSHQYIYNARDNDWYCKVCDAGHDWDFCGNSNLVIDSQTCQKIVYRCNDCGMYMDKSGDFPENHSYKDGYCKYCGTEEPVADEPPEEDNQVETEEIER